jgi:type IX secretion system substrate protein
MDDSSNLYVYGNFRNSVDFDPGPNNYNLTASGEWDIYLSKYDSTGTFLWAFKIGGSSFDIPSDIEIDSLGFIYLSGGFRGIIDFDPGQGVYNLDGKTFGSGFIAKFKPNSNLVWVKKFSGNSYAYVTKFAIDSKENIILCGDFSDTIDLDPGINSKIQISKGGNDSYICKLDNYGSFLWGYSYGGVKYDQVWSLFVDQFDNCFVSGNFADTVVFNPNLQSDTLIDNDGGDYLFKLSEFGNMSWAKKFEGSGRVSVQDYLADDIGNVIIAGSFNDTVDLDFGTGNNVVQTSRFSTDIFISKIDSNANLIWGRHLLGTGMGSGSDKVGSINKVDGNSFIMTGSYYGNVDFDPGMDTFLLSASPNYQDIFISKYDFSGSFEWAKSIGGIRNDFGSKLISKNKRDIYICGGYADKVDFDITKLNYYLNSNGETDAYLAKYRICQKSYFTFSDSTCSYYTSPSGLYIWDSTGVYFDTILNSFGCDSLLTINLKLNNIDTTVIRNSDTLLSNSLNSTYQWLDCDENFSIIPGEISSTYIPQINGNYAVEITKNDCVDTSLCYNVTGVGISKNELVKRYQLIPNPNDGNFMFICDFSEFISTIQVELLNSNGIVIDRQEIQVSNTGLKHKMNFSSLSNGIYLLKIYNNGEFLHSLKWIKY